VAHRKQQHDEGEKAKPFLKIVGYDYFRRFACRAAAWKTIIKMYRLYHSNPVGSVQLAHKLSFNFIYSGRKSDTSNIKPIVDRYMYL
jgi:hypothetical protein